ncbi:outer membrane protein assembly factor BamD [Candidatus Dependentiae bacterium]|nr:outer membrane protein assembly factor BamD [Candidatus Dependentiae bacterium]MBU4386913.1 outer membrane protein assembly factor BamD [Candidatus Dependentiae bacterium]MCG2756390.1 outer membrane protein assembly factor BamD [Candidatus Dependentiae bacterium]
MHKINNFNLIKLSKITLLVLMLITTPHCAKEEKKTEDLSFDELKQKTLASLKEKKYKEALQPLEVMVAQHAEKDDLSEYKLMLADSYFNTGNLPSAFQMYEHFKDFYPSDKQAEYAYYQAIKSKFYQTLKIDCDQSDTQETINLCKDYLRNPSYSKYKNDIEDIEHTCQRKLIDKEVYVYNFYLKKGKLKSAKNRLTYLKENYLDKDTNLNPRLLYLEAKLAQKEKDNDTLGKKVEQLMEQYPESPFTRMAQGLSVKNNFMF